MPASLTEVNKLSLVQPVLWLKYDLSLQNLALHTKMRQSPQMLKGPFKILPPAPPCTSGMCLYQRTAVSGCCCVWPLNRSMPLVTTAKLPSLFLPSCDQANFSHPLPVCQHKSNAAVACLPSDAGADAASTCQCKDDGRHSGTFCS